MKCNKSVTEVKYHVVSLTCELKNNLRSKIKDDRKQKNTFGGRKGDIGMEGKEEDRKECKKD